MSDAMDRIKADFIRAMEELPMIGDPVDRDDAERTLVEATKNEMKRGLMRHHGLSEEAAQRAVEDAEAEVEWDGENVEVTLHAKARPGDIPVMRPPV